MKVYQPRDFNEERANIGIELVRGCPYSCVACNPGKNIRMMNDDIFAAAVNLIRTIPQQKFIKLHGWGEPSLIDISRYAKTLYTEFADSIIMFSTNCWSSINIRQTMPWVDRVVVGLDSLDNTVHRKTRGFSNTNVIRFLETTQQYDKVTVVTLLHQGNINDAIEVGSKFPLFNHTCVAFSNESVAGTTKNSSVQELPRLDNIFSEDSEYQYSADTNYSYLDRLDIVVTYDGKIYTCLTAWGETSPGSFDNPFIKKDPNICKKCGMCSKGQLHRPRNMICCVCGAYINYSIQGLNKKFGIKDYTKYKCLKCLGVTDEWADSTTVFYKSSGCEDFIPREA